MLRLNVEMKSCSSCLPCPFPSLNKIRTSTFLSFIFPALKVWIVMYNVWCAVIDKAWVGWHVGTCHMRVYTHRGTQLLSSENLSFSTLLMIAQSVFLSTSFLKKQTFLLTIFYAPQTLHSSLTFSTENTMHLQTLSVALTKRHFFLMFYLSSLVGDVFPNKEN